MVVFWTDDYLDQVARQVRVVRIREPLTAELKDHTVRIRGLLAALGYDFENMFAVIPAVDPRLIEDF